MKSFDFSAFRARVTILFYAFQCSIILFVIVGFVVTSNHTLAPVVPAPVAKGIAAVLFILFLALYLGVRRFKNPAEPTAGEEASVFLSRRLSIQILFFALAELPAVLGVLLTVFSSDFTPVLMMGCLAAAGLAILKPDFQRIEKIYSALLRPSDR